MKRRDFLKASAALAGAAAGGFSCVEFATAAPIDPPVVDKLTVRVIVDLTHNIFLRPAAFNGMSLVPPPRAKDYTRELHSQWGLSLLLESVKAGETRTLMLDYAYTPEALLNNIELLNVDPKKVDALIVSHGHFDHYGGLIAFLDKYRGVLPADLKLYAGGEDNFCHRVHSDRNSRRVQRFRLSRPARARGAQCRRRAMREPDRDRRTRVHDRANQTADG